MCPKRASKCPHYNSYSEEPELPGSVDNHNGNPRRVCPVRAAACPGCLLPFRPPVTGPPLPVSYPSPGCWRKLCASESTSITVETHMLHCHSLQCYNCPNPTTDCKTAINCSSGFDTCLIARAGLQVYNQCWKFANCNYNDISTLLKESELRYFCCKKDLCNFNEQLENGGTSLSEKTVVLLVTPLLAAAWCLHP
uniref:CD59 glycoprotein n=1 Tax=Macaca mulatta TaxID=9544 RepID=A0A5F8AJX4_MACMU